MLQVIDLAEGWEFARDGETPAAVTLPHSPVEADLNGHGHRLGRCRYRRLLPTPNLAPGTRAVLYVGAAMHTALVRVDGREVATHVGGYLPFEVDLTPYLLDAQSHCLELELDNRDNADVPPGKPFAELDFCWYGGLYRGAELRLYPAVHITDPVGAGEVAGGGLFFRTLAVSSDKACVSLRVHVRNSSASVRKARLSCSLSRSGDERLRFGSELRELPPGGASHFDITAELPHPELWSPSSPALYELEVEVRDGAGSRLDSRCVRVGLRHFRLSRSEGLMLNGLPLRPRGTNRHQEYPFAGYAVPAPAQWREARRIKEAGFDFVRLSHYPQHPAFLDACDELGILVLNAIPGWQFIGGPAFRHRSFEDAREVIRRDRNHASVILWELSLNETQMDSEFMETMHRIGHEEYPGDQMYTAGWMDHAYDVYLHARQHGEIHRWRNGDKPLVISEYGDWEFYAANEGFDQTTGAGVHAAWSNSRHFRGEGERALIQQAENHLLALNDTLSSPAAMDGQWAIFDYARGYHPVRAGVGVMDIHRLPKFSYFLYRSQRDSEEGGPGWTGGPVLFIASHWTPASALRVLVFSNVDEVELRLNGRVVARKRPDLAWNTQHLPHPPFAFDLPCFEAGTLEAHGYLRGRVVARHLVSTPGPAARVTITPEVTCPQAHDLLFVHARVTDAEDNLCVEYTAETFFEVEGPGLLIGPSTVRAEAGIASVLLRVLPGTEEIRLRVATTAVNVPLTAEIGLAHASGSTTTCLAPSR